MHMSANLQQLIYFDVCGGRIRFSIDSGTILGLYFRRTSCRRTEEAWVSLNGYSPVPAGKAAEKVF